VQVELTRSSPGPVLGNGGARVGTADMSHTDEATKGAQEPEELSAGGGEQGEGHIEQPAEQGYETASRTGSRLQDKVSVLVRPEPLVTLVVVVACVVFTLVQFQPSKLFLDTTITGGDTGAHVLLPWVAMHQLLPHFRLTGWSDTNYDGFEAVGFYFPMPTYMIVVLAQLIPYNIAFKLVTAAPMILMPVAGWLMGRIAKAPFPVPAVLAAATLPFIFGTEYSIYGGNIASTLAGEFSFGWSLAFTLVFFGIVMRGLRTGRFRAWGAVIFACVFLCHIFPTLFAAVGGVVLVLLYATRNHDWRGALRWFLPTMIVGGLLTAWWSFPYGIRLEQGYLTNMGYTRITTYLSTLFPAGDTWLFVMAGAGAALCVARRRRVGEFLAIMCALSAFAFRFMPQSVLWNARVLPFWFITLYLLAGLAVAEVYMVLVERCTNFTVTLRWAALPGPLLVLVLALIWVGLPLRIVPGEHINTSGAETWLGIKINNQSYVPGWITWNYSGYQSPSKTRGPEYRALIAEMEKLSKTYGCGNAMWEYEPEMNDYGTPDALMILPYWTNGCIGSMEGLYYESSATTPFHFMDASELSLQPSDPMVGIPYASSPDVALGVEHLQMFGVKYYLAISPTTQEQAAANPNLKLIAMLGPYMIDYSGSSSGPTGTFRRYWKIYLVLHSPRVRPLANQPVVMDGLRNASQTKWLSVMTGWYDNPNQWDTYLAAEGPKQWARVPFGSSEIPVKAEPAVKVTDVVERNASISFKVSRVGVPMLVSVSYFPNWQVSGATGPYRVSPNLMVVVPTSKRVQMWYGYTPVDYTAYVLTILALVGLIVLIRRPRVLIAAAERAGLGQGPGPEHNAFNVMKHWWDGSHGNPLSKDPIWGPNSGATAGPHAWGEQPAGSGPETYEQPGQQGDGEPGSPAGKGRAGPEAARASEAEVVGTHRAEPQAPEPEARGSTGPDDQSLGWQATGPAGAQ
jgi:hypothetical protein